MALRDTITDSSELNVAITNFVESLEEVIGYFCDSAPHDYEIVRVRIPKSRAKFVFVDGYHTRPSKQVSMILCENCEHILNIKWNS